jgi:molybdate transport repressor ModE-like protein
MGPSKAELLERIRATGSIAAAGRQMRMSYKRAWMLLETMNTTRLPGRYRRRSCRARRGARSA